MVKMMSHYEDLTPYSYLREAIPQSHTALNVGWLENGHDFPIGETSGDFKDALVDLIENHPRARMRGWHSCTLPHGGDRLPYPYRMNSGGKEFSLGSAEVRVVASGGEIFIAPNLVYHYVVDHCYRPPGEFVQAVILGRSLPEIFGD
nr:hypothetical protein OH820_23775 [Streptomyces sp. NBC_00857]